MEEEDKSKRGGGGRSELQCSLSVAMQPSCTRGPRQLFFSSKQGDVKKGGGR